MVDSLLPIGSCHASSSELKHLDIEVKHICIMGTRMGTRIISKLEIHPNVTIRESARSSRAM